MPNELEIPLSEMRYDITMPLFEGRVKIDGVKLKSVKTSSMVFADYPELREGNFGVCDLNLGYFLPAIDAGWQLIGLPVFSKRKPVYPYIFCRADRGIDSPKDLAGKKIGTRQYRTAISVWVRGLLKDRYGVDISTMRWVAQVKEVFPNYDTKTEIEYVDGQKSAADRLLDGEVDAMVTDISDGKLLDTLAKSPKVKRLFPDYVEEDAKLYRETGIFTPVHIIVLSKKVDREHPELAGKLYTAFEQAKKMAHDDILNERGGFSVVYLRERLVEQFERWGDPWKYGIKANKSTIDAFIKYNYEQGMTRSELPYKDIFAAATLET
ncbi:MAG TPA: PhnD/SsuA/transferrin family substrate-binding protein [Candidatus Binatia bacterium]|jgi:4,5-dihydroxyphthalate decarboxylase